MKPGSAPTLIKTVHQPQAAAELEEKVRIRAYELYEQRGRMDGFALDDWLEAEAEVTKKATKAVAA
jgi:hypothetical protein